MSLQNLPNSDQKLDALFQAFGDLLFILDEDGTILDYKASDAAHLYLPPSQFLERKIQDILPSEVGKKFREAFDALHADGKVIQIEYALPAPIGEDWYEARLVPSSNGQIIVFMRDITKYKKSEVKSKKQLEQLASLRSIDLAITSGTNLKLMLSVILNHVQNRLGIDAASVLLLNPKSQRLEFAAGAGFRTKALQYTNLQIGEGNAGRSILERRIIHVPNLKTRKTDLLRSPLFSSENFVVYYAVPLIAKDQALGVLEIFHRAPLYVEPEWLDFMNALASQAAIAIENAVLFKNLEAVNGELTMAYDKTIESWVRALHIRDRETEEHTHRVTELTLRLSRQIGITDPELIHIRRGAILHDIGKVGIPDGILLKPGPLDNDEMKIMRQHPLIAVEFLKPISYLAPALTIPRSHHEKWDGSGYPDGLTAEQIPIAARIFAFIDVYDALISDRPYRSALPKKDALEYIQSQSGKHFDPNIVPEFMKMIETQSKG